MSENTEPSSPQLEQINASKPSAKPSRELKGELQGKAADSVNEGADNNALDDAKSQQAVEIGGPKGLEPTRYGDWEAKGRCYDF